MENRFEEPDFRKAILQDSGIGLWCIEIDEGKPPRAFLDDTFRKVMGIKGVLSPEESYCFWYERVLEADREKIQTAIGEMTAGRHTEVLYAWNHPETGIVYIRCGGTRDPDYKDGLRFCGSHQDVSQLARSRLSIERQLAQREKEYKRLTQASERSREILNALPGGVAVIRRTPDGIWTPEFLSDGFAAMCEMPLEQIWEMYRRDAMSGVHPDDQETLSLALNRYFNEDQECAELVYRLRRGQEGYFWVRNALTMVQNEQGARKVYCVYRDITEELQEKGRLRQQYSELLSRHYHAVGPGVLMAGHSNISQNRILEIVSYTDASLLQTTGEDREAFFIGLSGLVEGEKERQAFLNTFLNRPCLEAFARGQTGLEQSCFVHLPGKVHGQYIQFKVRMVTEPDSGDVTGILTAVDVTEQAVTRKILNRLPVHGAGYRRGDDAGVPAAPV
ncbi:MAG: PAS domain-containing protein [Oscillospiraceae bacterium]|nr:PAS domain-containing protein [Oscillospiraceae bacterium]